MVAFCFVQIGFAQDAHYNGQQPDSKGTLNGGTGTAGSRDLSAVYYNPGAIAFFEKSSIGLNGSLFTYDYAKITDQGSQVSTIDGSNFFVSPSLFAGTFKLKEKSKLTTSYSYFNTGYYNNRLYSIDQEAVLYQNQPALATNQFDQRLKYSEDWFGAGLTYRVNEHWGIGIIPFVHLYSHQYMQQGNFQVTDGSESSLVLGAISDYREARLFSSGMVFNFGVAYNRGEHEFGLNLITPRINFTNLSWSYIERRIDATYKEDSTSSSVLFDVDFRAIMHRPLEINIGYAWLRGSRSIKVRLSYYGSYASYVQGRESNTSIRTGVFTKPNEYNNLPVSNAKNVINLGIGYEKRLSPTLMIITGFRTDFTFFNKTIYKYSDFTTALAIWNIYHVSGGVSWQYKRLHLQTGIDYGFSYDKNLPVFANLEEPNASLDDVPLYHTANVNYQQFKVFIGLVLSLD